MTTVLMIFGAIVLAGVGIALCLMGRNSVNHIMNEEDHNG